MPTWTHLIPTSKFQIYISRSGDPFLNLSIEHYLLQKTPPHSTILFLYINRPCIVIGRNQNPWLEANTLSLRKSWVACGPISNHPASSSHSQAIQLVRRRSGGGAVFHDCGNVNYSVISPTTNFTRDKHAAMVTKAIRAFNARARVNERHDIVLDQGSHLPERDKPATNDMFRTAFHPNSEKNKPPLKVSGSAYKLTRQRALHHGTCLLASPNLGYISEWLRSPAKGYMKARGVDSVRSSIGNIPDQPDSRSVGLFLREVVQVFQEMYYVDGRASAALFEDGEGPHFDEKCEWVAGWVSDEAAEVDGVSDGIEELKSPKWLYGQTPQFTLSSHSVEEDDRERPPLPNSFPPSARAYLLVKSGQIVTSRISLSTDESLVNAEIDKFNHLLSGKAIHEINDFSQILAPADHPATPEISNLSRWLNTMFGKPDP